MMLTIPSDILMWEAVATVQIAQAMGVPVRCDESMTSLCSYAGLQVGQGEGIELAYGRAYKKVDSDTQPYVYVLAKESGLSLNIQPPKFPGVKPASGKYIVLCPFALKQELDLQVGVWRAVVRMLRMYDLPVYLMGGPGEWRDECAFSENEILSEEPIETKLSYLAGATLIVGVPNAWLWMATAWEKKLIYLYPDMMATVRWFHYSSLNYGRLIYPARGIQVSAVLAGLRQMIAAFEE